MISSIPVSAVNLGIDFKGYEELAKNIREIACLKIEDRQKFLDIANITFSRETNLKINKLVFDMADDREFYKLANMDYVRGPPEGEAIFTTTVIYYLLKRRLIQ